MNHEILNTQVDSINVLGPGEQRAHTAMARQRRKTEILKERYGGWSNIPGKKRTELVNSLRNAGCSWTPGSGWMLPNSHQISSNQL